MKTHLPPRAFVKQKGLPRSGGHALTCQSIAVVFTLIWEGAWALGVLGIKLGLRSSKNELGV